MPTSRSCVPGVRRMIGLNGHQTLVLERNDGGPLSIAAVTQSGVVAELTEHLAKQILG